MVLAPLAAAAGFALAVATTLEPGSAATTTTYTVWNYPGPASTGTVILNCGWHNVCTTGNDGDALDWANAAEQVVRWRSHSANTSGHPSAGTIHRENTNSGSCFNFNARFRSILGTDLGALRYVHAQPGSWTQVAVQSGGGFGVSMTMNIGTTKWEPSSCGTSGPHLHQGRQAGTAWTKHLLPSGYPTRATCWLDGCASYSSAWDRWQHSRQYAVTQ